MTTRLVLTIIISIALSYAAGAAVRRGYLVGLGQAKVQDAQWSAAPLQKKETAPSSIQATSITVDWLQITINRDGSAQEILQYYSPSGNALAQRRLNYPANSSQPVVDDFNNVVSSGGSWNGPANQIGACANMINTFTGNAASGGKLNLQ